MIKTEELSKSFKLYKKPSDRLKEIILRRPFHSRHQVLNNISFTLNKGEALGILGRNGAGKSTLLKILTGVLEASDGSVVTDGKITGLLELGTGFDFNLTGMQNIHTNGLLIGMNPADIEDKLESIIEFSELGSYIHEPIRTYSSGMVMRLAFAISIHSEPDVFIVDEALSVGDAKFQQKCMRKITEFRQNGGSLIFVSHDLNAVKVVCDRALVLEKGELIVDSDPDTAVNTYNRLLGPDDDIAIEQEELTQDYGSKEASIEQAELIGTDSKSNIVSSGEQSSIVLKLLAQKALDNLTIGMMVRDRFGQDIFGTNTFHLAEQFSLAANEVTSAKFSFPMNLAPGKYTITLALHEGSSHAQNCYHWWDNAIEFEVAGIQGPLFVGLCNLSPKFEIQ